MSRNGEELTKETVNRVLMEEAAIIQINEPNRKIVDVDAETGKHYLPYMFIQNFIKRNDLKSCMKKVERTDKPRIHECELCYKSFADKSTLRGHKNSVHKEFYNALKQDTLS